MDRFDRIYRLHTILKYRRTPVSHKALREHLECSRATVTRIIEELRDFLGAPIVYDRERNGYRYDEPPDGPAYELPGLWFSAEELQALLACQHLLDNIGPGLLQEPIAHLQKRMERLLALTPGAARPDPAKIKILAMGGRGKNNRLFPHLAAALFDGKRLHIAYRSRGKDETTERQISPQTLVRYRDNWYLDAWCHWRGALRSFAVERIETARTLDELAQVIGPEQLEKHFAQAYGIFAGPAEHTAVLRFSARRARWIVDEQWHSRQEGRLLDDGRYELRLPFGEHRELLMDILKYGADVEVVEPEFLRRAVEQEIAAMVKIYS